MRAYHPRFALLAASVAAFASTTGCNRLDPPYGLEPASSCERLEKEIKLQAQTQIKLDYGWMQGLFFLDGGGDPLFGGAVAEADMAAGAPARGVKSSTPRLHSDTNVQVEGVDEADLVETDGTYLYALAGDHLVITEAWPAQGAHEVGRLKIEGAAQGIYLREAEDRVAVLSTVWGGQPQPLAGGPAELSDASASSITKVTLVDVSDKSAPAVERETYLEGQLQDSRLVGDRLFVVTYVDLYAAALLDAGSKDEAMRIAKKSTLDDWMPRRADNIRAGGTWSSTEGPICDCTDVNISIRRSGTHMATISSFDVTDPAAPVDATSFLGRVSQVYASGRSLYLFSPEDRDGPWATFDDTVETIIHRFDIPEDGSKPVYDVSGKVPGWLLNQFSADEYEGKLRVATTDVSQEGLGGGRAGLYVLEPRAHELKMVGVVDPIVENESIFAVRFVGDHGYVVTFQQIDPLFVVDLSDPRWPEVRGQLEVPGFSNYLHPMDDTHLLAIGAEGGWGQGSVQVSIFDVSDDRNPSLASRLTLPESTSSDAQYDHHAFNYFAPQSALFVPVSGYDGTSEIRVVHAKVDENLEELGRVSTSALRSAAGFSGSQYDYCVNQRRAVVIEDALYAVSGAGIIVTQVHDPASVLATVPFTGIDPCADVAYGRDMGTEW